MPLDIAPVGEETMKKWCAWQGSLSCNTTYLSNQGWTNGLYGGVFLIHPEACPYLQNSYWWEPLEFPSLETCNLTLSCELETGVRSWDSQFVPHGILSGCILQSELICRWEMVTFPRGSRKFKNKPIACTVCSVYF